MHYSKYIEKPELLYELRLFLKEVSTYVTNWSSPEISSDTYRLYGRRTPANEATQNLINAIGSNISSENLGEKQASDKQRLRLSLSDWGPASEETSKKLNKKVKEPSTLLFLKVQFMSSHIIWTKIIVKDKWHYYLICLIKNK